MTILYIIIGIAIGWAIGFLDSNRNSSKKIEVAETRAQLAIAEAEKRVAGQGPATPEDAGLLRLRNLNGAPSLEVDGAALNVQNVTADQKRRLIELLNAIRPWIDSAQPLQPAPKPAMPPSPPPAPVAAVQRTTAVPKVLTAEAAALEEKKIRSLSIVAQIDVVLQKALSVSSSSLASKGIRLTESPTGGVEVYVGLQKYLSVDEVPDVMIQSAIRAAIAEWEKHYTPGA